MKINDSIFKKKIKMVSYLIGLKDQETKELDKSNIKETTEATDMGSTNPSSVANSDGFDDDSSKGGNSNHSNSNTRLTRSRANQGTPGPGDQANDSPRKYSKYFFIILVATTSS